MRGRRGVVAGCVIAALFLFGGTGTAVAAAPLPRDCQRPTNHTVAQAVALREIDRTCTLREITIGPPALPGPMTPVPASLPARSPAPTTPRTLPAAPSVTPPRATVPAAPGTAPGVTTPGATSPGRTPGVTTPGVTTPGVTTPGVTTPPARSGATVPTGTPGATPSTLPVRTPSTPIPAGTAVPTVVPGAPSTPVLPVGGPAVAVLPAPAAPVAPAAVPPGAVPAPTLGFGDPSGLLSAGGGLGGFAAYDPGLLLDGAPTAPAVTRELTASGPTTVTYAARLGGPTRATFQLNPIPVALVTIVAALLALAVRRATLRRATRRGR